MRGFLAIAVIASITGVAGVATTAAASPRADLLITWAPGHGEVVAAAAQAARRAGAAVIDASPAAAPAAADVQALRRGRAAYEALRFDEASLAFGLAAQSVELTGGAGLSSGELADVFLYRALTAAQRGEDVAAWDDFVRAASVDPTRTLDPALMPPRAVEQLQRAVTHVAALPQRTVQLRGEPGCSIWIDARLTDEPALALVRGRHWLVAACPGRRPLQRSFDVVEPAVAGGAAPLELRCAGEPLPAFGDDAALVQARTAGARAVLLVTVAGEVASLRRLAIDGREQERSSLFLAGAGSGSALAAEVSRLLRPPAATPWYRSRWTWAAAGVLAASAVLLPLVLQDDGAPGVVIRPEGAPW